MATKTQTKTKKSYSFLIMLLVMILTGVTAYVYAMSYNKLEVYMSWTAVIAMAAGIVAALVFSIIGWDELAAGLLAVGNLIGWLMFIQAIYGYVVVVLVGIDLNSFDQKFIVCATLFVVSFIASIVTVFLPKKKIVEIEQK